MMETLILKIETTGLNPIIDNLIQVCLIDTNGQIIFLKTIYSNKNKAFQYNGINPSLLETLPKININSLIREINQIVYDKTLISFNKDFDKSFLDISPLNWIDVQSSLKNRKRIPNIDKLKIIPSSIYRKALNVLEFITTETDIIPNNTISLNF